MEPIRVFVVDDHPMIRHGLAAMLKAEPGMLWVGDAADGTDAVRLAPALAPDVVLMDLVMPRMDGVLAIATLKPQLPRTKFVILTSLLEPSRRSWSP
jgi:YesN/AraC family two-component response regulator